ncbi:hypothetical protein [Methylobacterium hispanicum]|uniref:hypothetical protein n=1 Tax=Methylobacterium hispanicum TaxID=270350 RepID=UPI002F356EB0
MNTGVINEVSDRFIAGWCKPTRQGLPALLNLYVEDILLRSQAANIARDDIVGVIPSDSEPSILGFRFYVSESLLKLLPKQGKIKVVIDGSDECLPFSAETRSHVNGASASGSELTERLKSGHRVNQWGYLSIPFSAAPSRINDLLDLYCDVRNLLRIVDGRQLYLTGGNLLGLIREFRFLPHDDDLDASFCVKAGSPDEVVEKFYRHFARVSEKLRPLGFSVNFNNTGHYNIARGEHKVDILFGWIMPDGNWFRFTGFGGQIGAQSFQVREIDYNNRRVLIPQYAERELELTYGAGWRTPDPNFSRRRTGGVKAMIELVEKIGSERAKEARK